MPPRLNPPKQAVTEILPPSGWRAPALRQLVGHGDLVYFLAKRDVTVRYKQTIVGAFWAVLQPLLLAAVFTLVLGQLTDVPSGGTPYGLFALAGMTMWLFLAGAVGRCSDSTLASSELISKVYFPRMIVPLAALAVPAVDFVAALAVLIVILVVTGHPPGPELLLVPAVFLMAIAVALGIGLWLSALVVRYRDISLAVPFLLLVLLFSTPILYPLSLVPNEYELVLSLNPLVGVMEAFRWTVLADAPGPGAAVLISVGISVLLLASGVLYFARAEQRFADVI
ncbi:MAG TPA: ABC transporter permease [Thermoleophilaceae bacterium]|nr:ABC transporter permease [Thermoleophilaceae bacterium]